MKITIFSICLLSILKIIHLPSSHAQATLSTELISVSVAEPSIDLPQLLPGTSILVKIDLGKLELPNALGVDGQLNTHQADADRAQQLEFLRQNLAVLKEKLGAGPFYLMGDLPNSPGQPLVRLALVNSNERLRENITDLLNRLDIPKPTEESGWLIVNLPMSYASMFDRTFTGRSFTGNSQIDDSVASLKQIDSHKKMFEAGFGAVEQAPIQMVIVPPAYLWRTYEELMPQLPQEWGGGSTLGLTQGLRWAALALDPQSMDFSMTIQSANANAANELAAMASQLFSGLIQQLPISDEEKEFVIRLAANTNMQIKGDQIHYRRQPQADSSQIVTDLFSSLHRVFGWQFSRDMQPKLRQLALGILNYESAYSCFPPAAKFRDETGQSGLSWRVHILPFLGEVELYQQFKRDEPWDSPHNKPLLNQMPGLFRARPVWLTDTPDEVPQGYTTLVAPVGEGTIFGGNEVVTFGKISDGSSNTIMIVEVQPEFAVPWTAPLDYPFDPADPGKGLQVGTNGKFNAVLGDGAVRQIPADLPTEALKHLFQMNDGKVVRF